MSTMTIDTNNKKYAVQLYNGHIAIFTESQSDEILIYAADIKNGTYHLHKRRYLKEVESYILLMLLSEPGIVVSNARLQSYGINGKNITSSTLRQAILSLRNLLGDNSKPHRIIINKAIIGYSIQNASPFYEDINYYLQTISAVSENSYSLVSRSDIKHVNRKHLKLVSPAKRLTDSFLLWLPFGKNFFFTANFLLILYFILNFLVDSQYGFHKAAESVLDTHIEIVNQNFNFVIIRESKSEYLLIDKLKKALLNYLPLDDRSIVFEAIFIQNKNYLQLICLSSSDFSRVKNFRFTVQDFKSEHYLERLAKQCLYVN